MDQLLNHQWQRLLEIQKIQTELMAELLRKPSRGQGDWPLAGGDHRITRPHLMRGS